MNYGNKVTIKFTKDSPFCRDEVKPQIFRNVTEIRYKYHRPAFSSISLESGIHETGMTCRLKNVDEIETELESEKAECF